MNVHSKSQNIFELKIIHWNCFKMTKTRLYEFKLFLEHFQPDIVSVQEIKMNQEQSNLFLRFGSTNDFCRYRSSPIKAESKEDFPEPNSPITQMKEPFIIFRFKLLRHRISSKDFSSGLVSFFSSFFDGDFSSLAHQQQY